VVPTDQEAWGRQSSGKRVIGFVTRRSGIIVDKAVVRDSLPTGFLAFDG
jgi:hypothetical protein